MVDFKVQYRDVGCIAKAMSECGLLPGKTVKQLRDKRALASYKRLVEERLRPIASPALAQSESDSESEVSDHEEPVSVIRAMTRNKEVESEAVSLQPQKQFPITPVPPEDQNSEHFQTQKEQVWRRAMIREVLGQYSSQKAMPSEFKATVGRLRVALEYSLRVDEDVPQDRVDLTYRLVEELFQSLRGKSSKRPRKHGHGRQAYRRFVYSRAQELYEKKPEMLAKMVRQGVEITDEHPVQLGEDNIRRLYDSFWGTKPDIQIPQWGNAVRLIQLTEILTPFTAKEVAQRISRKRAQNCCRTGWDQEG